MTIFGGYKKRLSNIDFKGFGEGKRYKSIPRKTTHLQLNCNMKIEVI